MKTHSVRKSRKVAQGRP